MPYGHAEHGLVAVMGIQDHGIMGDVLENMGHSWKCSQTTKIMGDHGGELPTTW